MTDEKNVSILDKNRPLNDEEMALELAPVYPKTEKNKEETGEIKRRLNAPIAGIVLISLILVPFLLAVAGILVGYLGYYIGLLGAVIVLVSYSYSKNRQR